MITTEQIQTIEKAVTRGADLAAGLVLLSSQDWGDSSIRWDMLRNAVQGMAQSLEELLTDALEPVSDLRSGGVA